MAEDVQNALKDIFGPMFEAMLKGEMNNHLGYNSNSKEKKETDNRRNGYIEKNVKTSMGEMTVEVPRDRMVRLSQQLYLKGLKTYPK